MVSLIRIIFSLVVIFCSTSICSQELPYFFSADIRDTTFIENRKIIHGYATELLYSYNGNYKASVNVLLAGSINQQSQKENVLQKHEITNALDYIIPKLKNRQIVIINEAHHVPSNRIFSSLLLPGLAKLGFKYFAVEGLSRKNDSLNIRKYPTINDLYYYEPQFGNMVRAGLENGYRVLGYDTADFKIKDPILFAKIRDSLSAQRIKNILDKDPGAKIFIHCGYSHGYECTFDEGLGKRFASYVHELTGIDPYTINQDVYNERLVEENPSTKNDKLKYKVSAIKFNKKSFESDCADVTVMHSPTKFINNRPNWLRTKNKKYYFPYKHLPTNETTLVLAYRAGEPIGVALPIDVIEVKGKTDLQTALVLPLGIYNLLLIDQNKKSSVISISMK